MPQTKMLNDVSIKYLFHVILWKINGLNVFIKHHHYLHDCEFLKSGMKLKPR